VEDRPEHVARRRDVLGHEGLVRLGDARPPGPEARERFVVVRALRDRLLEDRGVARDPGHSVFLGEPAELPRPQQVSMDVVEPHALPRLPEGQQGILDPHLLHRALRPFSSLGRTRARTSLAAPATRSTVKPNSRITTGPGADAPKRRTPMIAPSGPAYRSHPIGDPASTVTLARTDGGRIASRYVCGWASKSSQDGIDTTRLRTPSRASCSWAASATETSDPVAIRRTSGREPSAGELAGSASTYAPRATPAAGARRWPRTGSFWRVRTRATGQLGRSSAAAQASTVEAAPGRDRTRSALADRDVHVRLGVHPHAAGRPLGPQVAVAADTWKRALEVTFPFHRRGRGWIEIR